jgi:alkyldihydroxyacetonephosphate synthase
MGWSESVAEGEPPPRMRWWGWGDPSRPSGLPAHALSFLADTVGVAERPRPPVALERVRLDAPSLSAAALESIRDITGRDGVRDDHADRVEHAVGRGYPDLVRMRAGAPEGAPDAVVYPAGHEQVRAVLDLCAQSRIAVVPFGGGTSVVGGVSPLRGEQQAVIALDLGRMRGLLSLDRASMTAQVGAGMRAAELERRLGAGGLTLGHFPQSFEYVSLGGCAATRSAGQSSTGYGSIEEMVLGMRFAAPSGDIDLEAQPASAAGPGLRQLLVGSEGTLGVISELSLRVRGAPGERVYEGFMFEDFSSGVEVMRTLAQEHAAPDVARLSDRPETRMSLALAGTGGAKGRIGRAYMGLRGYGDGCLAIMGFEGERDEVAFRRTRALARARAGGALSLGRSPGEAWRRARFSAPYLRDDLLTHGVMVETLETATQWSNLHRLHDGVALAIAEALEECGTPGLVMCHVSHLYESGASLYFTFIARMLEDDPIGQWRMVKERASRAIVEGAGTITHHHAVGVDHAVWMDREVGAEGVAAIAALKSELDPAGIMNPGKLLPLRPRG